MSRPRRSISATYLVLVAILFAGLAEGEDNNAKKEIRYQFELAPEKETVLLNQLGLIHLGDSKKRVEEIMGLPSRRDDLIDKKGKFNSSVFDYDIKRVEIRNVNIHDQLISIYFDQTDHAIRIVKPGTTFPQFAGQERHNESRK